MNMVIKPDDFIVGRGGGGKSGSSGDSPKNSIRSNAIAEILELICEGPIKGLVNGPRSIFLNETPLKSKKGTFNFKGVSWDFRRGGADNEDKPMKGNNRVEFPVDVSTECTKDGGDLIRTVTNPLIDSVRVVVRIPALYQVDQKKGKMKKTDLHYKFWTRRPAGSGPWNLVVDQNFTDEKTSSVYQKAHAFDLPDGTGDCEIRMERITDDADDEKLLNESWWDSYIEVIKGKFYYPHSSIMRLTMDAEKVGSSIPSRAVEVYGMIVRVPTNYDPDTRVYTGVWDGTFKNAWTDNPAWVFYDLITTRRYGMGEFVAENQVDKWSLYTVAKHCDELVDTGFKNDAGNKIREPRYTFNGVLSNRDEAFNVLKQIAATWRGMVYWSLGQIFATLDKAADPVNIMTPANVINGEFKYSGTSLKATHSVVLVTWNDPDDFYKPATEVVINEELLKKYGWREKTLQLTGCTSRSMAHRYGRWILDTEQFETETVEYVAGLDNCNLRPGDIVGIADPMKAQIRAGGRLRAAADVQYALLDQPFVPIAGQSYKIMMTRPSGAVSTRPDGESITSVTGELVTKNVQSFGEEVFEGGVSKGFKRVNFAGADLDGSLPKKNSMFAITGDVQLRKYRVLSVREEAKHQFRVIGLFHDPNKFARVERNVDLQPIQYTRHERFVEPATELRVVEKHYLDDNNQLKSDVHISWSPSPDPLVKDYRVTYLHPTRGRINLGFTDTVNMDLNGAVPGDYVVKVYARSFNNMLSEELRGEFTVEGPGQIPAPVVANLQLSDRQGTIFTSDNVEITWRNKFARASDATADDYAHVDDFSPLYAYTRVKIFDIASGDLLRSFKTTNDSYIYSYRNNKQDNKDAVPSRTPSRSLRFEVTVADKLGRESAVQSITVNNPAPPAPNFTVTQRGTTMQVNIAVVDAEDIDGYMVWISQSAGFTPGAGNLVYDGNGRHPQIDVQRGKTYYVICAAYDKFNKSLLNYSAQIATVANSTVSDGQAPATPTGVTATSSGDTDAQGHVRSMVKFNWNDNAESFFDHYELEIQEEGADYTSLKKSTSKHSFRAKTGNTYRYRVRACDAVGNKSAYTAWGAINTSVVAAGDTTAPEKAVITKAVGRVKGVVLTVTDCGATDYKKTGYWRYTSLANATADDGTGRTFAGWGAETFVDNDDLPNATDFWYRAAHKDKTGNLGVKSDPFKATTVRVQADDINDGAVAAAKTDQTAPATPGAAPTMNGLTVDIDLDGDIDKGFWLDLPSATSGVPVKFWEIEVQVAAAQGASNSMTGYAKRGTNITVKAEAATTTYVEFKGNLKKWFKCRYRGISFSGKEGGWSAYQLLGAKPGAYDVMTGVKPATPVATALANGIRVAWTIPTDATYDRTGLYQGATLITTLKGSVFLDQTVRTVGTGYPYTVKHYDRSGNVTNSSDPSNSAVYRAATSIEIADGAIIADKTDQTAPAPLATAPVAAQVLVDVDGDGKSDIAIKWTWTKPTDTVNPIVAYQVSIYENTVLIDTFQTGMTTITRKAKTRVNVAGSMVASSYYAIVTTIGFNGKISAIGSGTSNTVAPTKKAAVLAGTFAVTSLTVAQKDYGAYLSWARSGEPDYLESRVYRYLTAADAAANTNGTDLGSIYGNWFQDMNVDLGTRYWYRIQHYDRSGNPGALSSSVNLTVRGPSRKDNILVSPENLILDADCADLSQWSVTQSNNDLVRLDNVGNYGAGRYKLRASGASLNFYSALIPVPPRGGYYRFSCFVGPEDGSTYDVGINYKYFYRDNSGNLVEGFHPSAPGGSAISVNDTVQTVSALTYLSVDQNLVGDWGIQFIQVKIRVVNTGTSRQLNMASPTLVEMIDTPQMINGSVTYAKMAENSVGALQLRNGGVPTIALAASAATQKYQVQTNAGLTLTTTPQEVQSDIITWGSDFEWLVVDFQAYVGANTALNVIVFELRQGTTVLYTFQGTRTTTDFVSVKRAFKSTLTGTSGTIRMFASTVAGTVPISDRQMINTVFYR